MSGLSDKVCKDLGISYKKFIEMTVDYASHNKEGVTLREVISNIAENYIKTSKTVEEYDDDALIRLVYNGGLETIGWMLVNFLEEYKPGLTDGRVASDVVHLTRKILFHGIAEYQTDDSRTGLPEAVVKELPIRLGLKDIEVTEVGNLSKTCLSDMPGLVNIDDLPLSIIPG